MRKVIIPMDNWLRLGPSQKETNSALAAKGKTTKMCCLGHYLKACDVRVKDMMDKCTPSEIHSIVPTEARWLLNEHFFNSQDCSSLSRINDDKYTTDNEKITEIKRIFKKHNVQVKFVKGSYKG